MREYRHILMRGEISSGRIYVPQHSEGELKGNLGLVQDRAFNIFLSDGTLVKRNAKLQKTKGKAGLRLNCGQDTFKNCTSGTPIFLSLRPDNDIEIKIQTNIDRLISDEELDKECGQLLENPRLGNYWQAVNLACTLLESRIRAKSGAPKNVYGYKLIDYALHPQNGKLICRDHSGEQDGIFQLCSGVMKAYRNPNAHQKSAIPRDKVRKIVGIVDLLLEEIEESTLR
ncbi:MAG: TIGR02391 family protein [Anaerolineaceae bacterium]|nr:TIGR02391 family protein [Anaerolineaceae bacterium]